MLFALLLFAGLQNPLDLRDATVRGEGLAGPSAKAMQMLVEEVESRTRIRWRTGPAQAGKPSIILVRNPASGLAPEAYRITVTATMIRVEGADDRGVLFGVGKLLRSMEMRRDSVQLPAGFDSVTSAPKYKLRGHQLGYRPKTNSYDAWSAAMWEQYFRDLIIFGANAVELIPPRSDDDADSPHFPLPPMKMMIEMSRLAKEYGLELWIWYPAMDKDYSQPATVDAALKEWGDVFRQLPRIDAIFVPGGDPGHTQPKYMMALLEKQTANLHKYHPKAQMWMSPQSFNAEWMDEFFGIMERQPAWLSGIVFGPQNRTSLPALRERIPKRYPIRFYPDITHSLRAQYPVPDWDAAFALTLEREPINPRPVDQRIIFRRLQPYADAGFITYSEGCNDDVNKAVWSALGWDPDADLNSITRDYARYFIGADVAESFGDGLLALERNWRGPAAKNPGIETTLSQFQAMERAAPPERKRNWRFQQALYRAYYDAFQRTRVIQESMQESRALDLLGKARESGAVAAVAAAEKELLVDPMTAPGAALRARVFELAEALFQSVRMQLSVPRYQAIAVGRGANLDLIDTPLNNRNWLARQFAAVRAAATETERLKLLDTILHWTNPGPGGFYDDLGNPTAQPHLVRGEAYDQEPAMLHASLTGFANRANMRDWRISWRTHAETLGETPLELRYAGLDPAARYKVRVVYGGDAQPIELRLTANGTYEVHSWRKKDAVPTPVEFAIPREATAGGSLSLQWTKQLGQGGAGRGVQVCEVWLVRE
ncbi:MAG TPA: glycoside hydrolase family 20 zincin-like fold domain-containing protein [Paludibaculum sp.]|jgi:hypothetical protein